ncbi:hypothetical protein [Rhizobium sp. CAU 1783]
MDEIPIPQKIELAETLKSLRQFHPFYRRSIDKLFWYTDPILVRFGETGPSSGIDATALRLRVDLSNCNESGYWLPHPDLRSHIVKQANAEIGRLNVAASPEDANPNFSRFHSQFDASLAQCEINDTVRLCSLDGETITIAKATYLDQIGTNITADKEIELPLSSKINEDNRSPFEGKTLRQMDTEADGRLKPLSRCVQANTIGVATVALDADNNIIARYRNFNRQKLRPDDVQVRLGAMNKGWHCFSSGVLEWSDIEAAAEQQSTELFCANLTEAMRREIWYETGFPRDSREYTIVPYAFVRELKRPGKPQFFFVTKFHNLTAEEICSRIDHHYDEGIVREAGEYGTLEENLGRKLKRMLSRKRQPSSGFWIIKPDGLGRLSQGRLADLSVEGHNNETFTYELYGALFILSGLDISEIFGEQS